METALAGIKNYGLITSIEELAEYADRMHGHVFGYDIETGYHGADREKGSIYPETALIAGISFTDSLDWARYVPLAHDDAENVDNHEAAKILWDLLDTGLGVAHNAGFELRHLARFFWRHLHDDPVRGEKIRATNGYFKIHSDTLVEAYLMQEYQGFGLKHLTKEMFGHQQTELHELFVDLPVNKRKFLRFNTLELTPQVISYACEDSVWCLAIHQKYHPKVKDKLLYKVEKAIVQDVLPPMEDHGIRYDWVFMRRTADFLRTFRDRFNAEIMADLSTLAGQPVAINLASPKQVATILFETLGMRTTVYTTKTRDLEPGQRKMSTGDIALRKLANDHPVIKKILQWREITKLLGSYLDKYEAQYNYAADGRAHPNHLSAFVRTGRFAHSNPNYAQSPKKYHIDLAEAKAAHDIGEEPPAGTCFKFNFRDVITVPAEHYGLGFDLSQAELRAIAGEAQEIALLEAFERGEDVHRLTASLMLGIPLDEVTDEQRGIGKTMNFALLYGMSTKGLADRLGIPIEEAQSLMDKYFAGLPAIAAYIEKQQRYGREHGYVTSKFGRILPIWEFQSDKPWIRQSGERACVNYPIQGAATGDYMKIAMVRAVDAIRKANLTDKIKLVMNIHDALEFYVHKSIEPKDAIAVIAPAVVFDVPGWPVMKADWHLFKRWGSPIEIEVNDDGSILVKGEKVYELAPAVEQDEDGESVEVLPEVDEQVLREAVKPVGGIDRRIVVTMLAMPTVDGWQRFKQLLAANPGANAVYVSTPEGDIDVPLLTSLSAERLSQEIGNPDTKVEYLSTAFAPL